MQFKLSNWSKTLQWSHQVSINFSVHCVPLQGDTTRLFHRNHTSFRHHTHFITRQGSTRKQLWYHVDICSQQNSMRQHTSQIPCQFHYNHGTTKTDFRTILLFMSSFQDIICPFHRKHATFGHSINFFPSKEHLFHWDSVNFTLQKCHPLRSWSMFDCSCKEVSQVEFRSDITVDLPFAHGDRTSLWEATLEHVNMECHGSITLSPM
jgi:hypothetical protein